MPALATGSYQNLLINQMGKVVSWGGGRLGQLGIGVNEDRSSPVDITSCIKDGFGIPMQVSAGCAHSAVVTDQGLALTFGDGRYNQLGHSDTRVYNQPCLVQYLSHIQLLQVSCGSCHTLFVDTAGYVYSVGQGDNGQLGQGDGNRQVSTPLPIELPEKVRIMYVDAGVSHNVLVSYCGKLLTHGFGGFGQLGHGGTRSIFTPQTVADLLHVKIVYAAAGPKQTLCVDSKGRCYAFGYGADGTLALGNYENTNRPRFIEALEGVDIKMVAASQETSLFVSLHGTAYWSGIGLGHMQQHKTCLPTVIRMCEHIEWGALGDSHAALLTRSGNVLTIGKNGRGQAGQPETEQVVDSYTKVAIMLT
ncbi:uncharacterized protein LOC134179509 isoform X2 [Corticium candelabrum]|nr:uncharacterized protein LOC134179509 isoform X2 [Corticium candelabrum]XP_062502412.1 uncharacterized protein LOC134179509 isoform X2 [Corticium candelabrum]